MMAYSTIHPRHLRQSDKRRPMMQRHPAAESGGGFWTSPGKGLTSCSSLATAVLILIVRESGTRLQGVVFFF